MSCSGEPCGRPRWRGTLAGRRAMVVTSNSDEVSSAIEASPSDTSLRGLDAVNLLLAGVLSGFGPYVAVFLADQSWTQQSIGFVLTAGGFVGLLTQLPAGGLLDAVRSKRAAAAVGATMVAVAALIIAMWPSFPLVLAALALQAMTGGLLRAGGRGHQPWPGRPCRAGRAPRPQSTFCIDRRSSRDGPHGAHRLFCVVSRNLPRRRRAGAAAADRSRQHPEIRHPLRPLRGVPDHHGPSAPPRARHWNVWTNRHLLIFAGCVFLFQLANASMLPLAGESLIYGKVAYSSLIVSALIIVPQVIVALMAPWVGDRAKIWGRRPLLLSGFAALPIRALLFAWTTDPMALIAAQVLDGISGAMLGVLTALVVADLTNGTGRFNLAQGFIGTMSGIGASLSTTLSSQIAGSLGRGAGFLGISAVALAAALLLWFLMPETNPSSERPVLFRGRKIGAES